MPGLLQSLLTGQGAKGLEKYLARNASRGVLPRIHMPSGHLHPPPSNLPPYSLANFYHTAKGMAFGDHGLEVLKQRMIQGGLVGRGGVTRGALSFNPEMGEAWRQHGGLPSLWKAPGKIFTNAGAGAVNNAFILGIPGYAAYRAAQRGDNPEVGRTIGETLGWTLANPFGTAGYGLAIAGGALGRDVLGPRLPQIVNPSGPSIADRLVSPIPGIG